MVRLEKVVYRDHVIKEKELNLQRETKQLRDSKGTGLAAGFQSVGHKLTESAGRETQTRSRSGKISTVTHCFSESPPLQCSCHCGFAN